MHEQGVKDSWHLNSLNFSVVGLAGSILYAVKL